MRACSSTRVAAHAANSWPTVMGTASWSWVRPTFGTDQNSRGLGLAGLGEHVHGSEQAVERGQQAQPQRRGIDVVGALAAVHVVERDAPRRSSPRWQAEQLERAVGDDLVGVHVRRRAGAALNDVDHELVVEQPVPDVLAGTLDRVRPAGIDQPELVVRADGGQLDRAQARHQRGVDGDRRAAGCEVLEGARGVHAPVRPCREPPSPRGSPAQPGPAAGDLMRPPRRPSGASRRRVLVASSAWPPRRRSAS